MIVHNKTTSNSLLSFSALSVATGTMTNIEIDRTFSSYLPSPYSGCQANIDENHSSKLVKAILKKTSSYSQQNCFLACYQLYALKECNCYNAYLKTIIGIPDEDNGFSYCNNLTLITCEQIVTKI